ncbi:MAG: spore maturation protein [Eubacterium sp.]|nr:spore maturation protein [Eubacterium sp.]
MKILLFLSEFILPFCIFYIVIYGYFQGTDVYESFLKGAVEGFKIIWGIAPTLLALLVSVGIFRSSGALDSFCRLFHPLSRLVHIPMELIPVIVVRCFSSSAALGFVLDIFKEYGPDSRIGMTASILMSCTETVLYTITVYFMSIKVKKTRWTLPGALFATLAGAAASVLIAGYFI